jgi:flagellar assembly protein FliH
MNTSRPPATAWRLPNVAGPVIASRGRSTSANDLSEQVRASQQHVFEEARQLGFEQGMIEANAVRDQLLAETVRLNTTFAQAAKPLAQLDTALLDELSQLALCIGKQLARRELRIDPAQVAAIVRETIALLPANSRDVRVVLHPADAAVMREKLAPASAESAWQLLEDPVMGRGGCRVVSEHVRIDASFEGRVAAIASALLDPGSVPS